VARLDRRNRLKITSPGALNIAPIEGKWVKAGHPCKLVVFRSQGREVRGPSWLRMEGRTPAGGMGGQERGQARGGDIKPLTNRIWCGPCRAGK